MNNNGAYIFSQSVAALVRLEAMKALNEYRARRGENQAYDEAAFESIIIDFGLGYNDVMTALQRGL